MTSPHPSPTRSELEILQVLWRRGPSTVREVVGEIPAKKRPGYTTILKLLQIMTEKGLVTRDESRRSHVYSTVASRDDTQSQLLGDLMDRAFEGSTGRLVMRALSSQKASPEELREIRRLLDDLVEDA